MEINVRFQLDVSPAFRECMTTLLEKLGGCKWSELPSAINSTPAGSALDAPAPAEPAPAEPAPGHAPASSEEMYSDAYLRAAMDKTRARIIGEDWNTDKTTDRYKRYFSALNTRFRALANAIAIENDVQASKPTELPKTAVRERFVRECDELELDENGEITVKLPF